MRTPSDLGNANRFSGVATRYDEFRPRPPTVILDLLCQLAQEQRPQLVVDLGSGTGLSTVIWSDRAVRVVGIEPNSEMRDRAAAAVARSSRYSNVEYRPGFGHDTGLPGECAEIVTCSQSLHWMDPEPTFAEVARVLRPGGVVAAFDCDWPPTMNWQAEQAFDEFVKRCEVLGDANGWYDEHNKWIKSRHLERMRSSNRFTYTREVLLHSVDGGNADRLIGLALSQARVSIVLDHGVSESESGLDHFRDVCHSTLGSSPVPWFWSYRVHIGIKAPS